MILRVILVHNSKLHLTLDMHQSYLTNGIGGLDRFPVSFRTMFNRATYNHVVLGVYYNGYYGALGMSRRQDLMNKPLKFKVTGL